MGFVKQFIRFYRGFIYYFFVSIYLHYFTTLTCGDYSRSYKEKNRLQLLTHGRTHGAPYHGYGYVPLRFGGTSLGEWEHNNKINRPNGTADY